MNWPEVNRSIKIIKQVIDLLQLDLNGLTVLTEVGSGLFVYTPIIAAMAGAKRVFAWTNDSSYGKGEHLVAECKSILKHAGISDTTVVFSVNNKTVEQIGRANIITNSGHIRPIDKIFLSHVNPDATVIPLMYEKWELRESDIDINYCVANNIKVAGTWENHPDLKIFDFCEQLILKLVFEAGYEISGNKILIWSSDHYGELAINGFTKNGGQVLCCTTDVDELYNHAANADFILFCDYMSNRNLISVDGDIDLKKLKLINPAIGIVHLSGAIDNEVVKQNNLAVYPDKKGLPVRMTFTLAHLGLQPTLYLQAAGLKVGELLQKKIYSNNLIQLI